MSPQTFGTAAPPTPRVCARCGKPESPPDQGGYGSRRHLMTIGTLLELPKPSTEAMYMVPEVYSALWVHLWCRSRECIIIGLLDFARRQLYTKFHTGRGLRKAWK